MPVFEYKCCKCDETFKLYRRLVWSDKDICCPKCGTPYPERIKKGAWDKFLFIFEGGAPAGSSPEHNCFACTIAETCPARREREPQIARKK